VAEVEIGLGKSGRRAYGFDDIAIVPSRRTRDPEDVDISWEIDAFRFDLPLMGAAMDGVISPATAIEIGRLGGVGVLNLEGLWTRYEDPESLFAEIAELDLLVIQGTVVSAEHVSKTVEPLNLKRFVRELDIPVIVGGCASYQAALHLMRTGAAGILVGVGPGHACTTRGVLGIGVPQATAIADARAARMRHLDETGVYVQVIADGGMATGGDIAKAIVCGADAVMIGSPLAAAAEAPGKGYHWGMATFHPTLPRGARVKTAVRGTLQEILVGPAHENDGRMNLFGALRTSMATCGYETVKEFQKAEVMVAPALQTEGKSLQKSQGIGIGS
jgi:IMP dehydrogenase